MLLTNLETNNLKSLENLFQNSLIIGCDNNGINQVNSMLFELLDSGLKVTDLIFAIGYWDNVKEQSIIISTNNLPVNFKIQNLMLRFNQQTYIRNNILYRVSDLNKLIVFRSCELKPLNQTNYTNNYTQVLVNGNLYSMKLS